MLTIHPDLELLWQIAEWLIRIAALGVIPLRRSPTAAASWLLLIFFFPVVGLPLYLLIGRPKFPRAREQRWRKLQPYHAEIAARIEAVAGCVTSDVQQFAHELGRMPCAGGNAIELIEEYDAVIDRLVADIDAARHRVDLLVYIFADDAVGQRIADAMERARRRGVRCRAMFDYVGSRPWRRGTVRMLRAAGVEIRTALPVRLIRRRSRADMRNHRKLFVIDDRIGYAGSQNLVAKDFRRGVVNRELVARVTGPVVASMAAVIAADWWIESREEELPVAVAVPDPVGEAQAQLLPTSADYRLEGFETLLVWQLHRAHRHVVIVTPYFVPDEAVIRAMRSAAARGVRVDLVVSSVVDQHIVHLAQCSYFEELLAGGVRIHRYRDFLLHAKTVSIDDTLGIVGSSNVDLRSFQLNEEASLLLYDAATIARLRAIHAAYLDASDTVDLVRWRGRSWARRLPENIARIMSALL